VNVADMPHSADRGHIRVRRWKGRAQVVANVPDSPPTVVPVGISGPASDH